MIKIQNIYLTIKWLLSSKNPFLEHIIGNFLV